MDQNASSSSSFTDSGVQTLIKRRKIEEKNTAQTIIDTMQEDVSKFCGHVWFLKM